MEVSQVTERFGELTKEEPVSTLAPDLIMPETVVFEAVSPFYGYYDDAPLAEKKPYVYFLLDECHSLHMVSRAIVNIRKIIRHEMTADLGSISLNNQTLPVIRIKHIDKFCRVSHLQKCFLNEGIRLKKAFRQVNHEMALITIQKFMQLVYVGDGLYMDQCDSNKGYFSIPQYLDWKQFKALTIEAKYDTSILYFDAAQAVIFENNKVIELVRIYRELLAVEKLSAIRDRYLKVLG
jgi:hypothetical protein